MPERSRDADWRAALDAAGLGVDFGSRRRAEYSADASNYRHVPRGVGFPRDADEVARAVAISREHGVPVTLRGGGTSVAGNAIGEGLVLDCSRYALQALTRPVPVRLYTDSRYVLDGITRWIPGWQRNGWMTAARKPVKNVDLWQRLVAAMAPHDISWHWVKGHAGDPGNERADELARLGIKEALAGS